MKREFSCTEKWSVIVAGVRGKSGRSKKFIFSRAYRISLASQDADLLPFFQGLDKMPPGRRNAVLLAAIRGGAISAQQVMSRNQSCKVTQAIDAFLTAFDQD